MNKGPHRLTKIYTRSGDAGETGLVGSQRVSKSCARIDAYGTVDELSSVLGIARALNWQRPNGAVKRSEFDQWLREIQNDLFHVGADLATLLQDRWAEMHIVGDAELNCLERRIDQLNEELGPLQEFVLPGGGSLGAFLHLARTICRRAERLVTGLSLEEEIDSSALRYLNRLSDFLFVLARAAVHATGNKEYLWQRDGGTAGSSNPDGPQS